VTFLSPSAVTGLDEGLPAHGLQARAVAACIGTVTAEAARRAGWERVAVAARPTVEDLAAVLATALLR
jgi:uroporphyrinogen-III synthase